MTKVGFQHIISTALNQRGPRAVDRDQKADPRQSERVMGDKDSDGQANDDRTMEEMFVDVQSLRENS